MFLIEIVCEILKRRIDPDPEVFFISISFFDCWGYNVIAVD